MHKALLATMLGELEAKQFRRACDTVSVIPPTVLGNPSLADPLLAKLLSLADSNQIDLQFAVGDALSSLMVGEPLSIPLPNEMLAIKSCNPHDNALNMLLSSAEKAGSLLSQRSHCIWLLALVRNCGTHNALSVCLILSLFI